jgi:hypothetical protein
MILFHGTTFENAKKILKQGFKYKKQVWACSENKTYFMTSDYISEAFELDDESDIMHKGIQEALDQSRFALAVENPSDYRGAVLVFDSSKMKNKDQIEPDYSCENMEHCVCLENPDMDGLIGFYVMQEEESLTRPMILASFVDRDHAIGLEFSEKELSFLKSLAKAEIYVEEMFQEIEYYQYQQEEVLKKVA